LGRPACLPENRTEPENQKTETNGIFTCSNERKKMNCNLPNRKSIRLKGYDYLQAGLYFITICAQNRVCLFGEIIEADLRDCQKMILNDAGKMVQKWYYELENKFNDIKCLEMVIMPNHFHCIIENVNTVQSVVGADLSVCPKTMGEHVGSSLYAVVQWFKTITTNEYIRGVKYKNWQSFDKKMWQRNYWEHIVRNENEYMRIAKYIIENPLKWKNDKFNNGDGNVLMESSVNYENEIWMI
jgi:REP element-mobilizing transposase RayT